MTARRIAKLDALIPLSVAVLFALPMKAQFRAGDQVLLPAIGSAPSGGLTYASDLAISNWSDDDVAVSVVYTPVNTADPTIQRFPNVIHLKARQRLEFPDFVRNNLHISGIGAAHFNGCKEGADCSYDTSIIGGCGGPSGGVCTGPPDFIMKNYRNISVESRIYSYATAGGPTVGQSMPAIPWRQIASADEACSGCVGMAELQIVGIRSSAAFHTNIGYMNASEFSACYLTLSLYDGADGGLRDQRNIRLAPLQNMQENVVVLFPLLGEWSRLNRGRAVTSAVVVITQSGVEPTADAAANGCAGGCPRFAAYGSMIDNKTGDPTTLEAQYPGELLLNQSTGVARIARTPFDAQQETAERQIRPLLAAGETAQSLAQQETAAQMKDLQAFRGVRENHNERQ